MKSDTHKIGGICAGIVTISSLSKPPYKLNDLLSSILILLGSAIGSLIPDIDTEKSTIGRKFKIASSFINKTCSHRGFTHSPLVSVSLYYILLFIGNCLETNIKFIYDDFLFGTLIGVISHILLDSMTIEGVPMFYPFNKRKYHIARFRTGKNEEIIQCLIILITILIILRKGR